MPKNKGRKWPKKDQFEDFARNPVGGQKRGIGVRGTPSGPAVYLAEHRRSTQIGTAIKAKRRNTGR